MLATVTERIRHHVPMQRTQVPPVARLVADDGAIRRQWVALLAAATSPEERDEINDVFGRTVR